MSNRTALCIFRKGSTWLALPAKVVREVRTRPRLVTIPRSSPILSGMSHIRSEFLPVLNLSELLPEERSGNEDFLLIIEDADGDWGLLVDEVRSLAFVEFSNAPEEHREMWESAVVGWTTYEENIIRILDNIRFRELASRQLRPTLKSNSPQRSVASGLSTSTSHH